MRLPTQRRFLAGMLIVSLLLSLAGTAAPTPATDAFRIVRIRGRRVHLRQGIPPQLTHDNVIRHLRPGQVLVADRLGYGIGYDGKGGGTWMHLVDPDSNECGWVNSHFIEVIGEVIGDEDVERKRTISSSRLLRDSQVVLRAAPEAFETRSRPLEAFETRSREALHTALRSIHDKPPPDAIAEEPTFLSEMRRKYGNDIQFAASIANIMAVLILLFNMFTASPVARVATATPIAVITQTFAQPPATAGDAMTSSPNFIYGVSNGVPFRIPLSKK